MELQRGLRIREGLKNLGRMEGIDSLGDSLEWEGKAIKRQIEIDEAVILGTNIPERDSAEADEMVDAEMRKTLIAGDYQVNKHYHYTEIPPANEPTEPAAPTAAADVKPKLTQAELDRYIQRKVEKRLAEKLAVVQQPQAATTAQMEPASEPWYKRLALPIATGAAIIGTGGAGLATYNYLTTPTAVVDTDTDTDTRYNFEISSDKGKGFSTE